MVASFILILCYLVTIGGRGCLLLFVNLLPAALFANR